MRALSLVQQAAVFASGAALELPSLRWRELWSLARSGPLILHAHRNLEIILGLLLRALGARVRLVATRHAASPPSWLSRWLMQRVDLRVALTEEVARQLPPPVRVIGHGVDVQRFVPPRDRASAFRALGLPGERGIGVVGRVRPEKGQGDFVAAWATLGEAAQAGWTPVLVGAVRPAERGFARALSGQLPELVLVGEIDRVERWLAGLTIVVQPSRSEGFSLVLLEAMAAGACVVAAALPHFARGIVEPERTGFLYPPGDVAALAAILGRLVRDPETVRRVGEAAAAHVRARFAIEHEAQTLSALYRGLSEPAA